ncbi:DUF5071 domain-containing protein [Paenibacillus sp. TRM 82003]|nr:DUF5071 domain-containing protein [Paenibacillus sp. TRM 82003]
MPRHAEDREAVSSLRELPVEELASLAPALLVWLQDEACPIAPDIAGLLLPLEADLVSPLRMILTSAGHANWKRAALRAIVTELPPDVAMELVPELIRLAMNATDEEQDAEVDELAEQLLERWL